MKYLSLALLLGFTAAQVGCINLSNWQTVRGSGNISNETREVRGFDQVSVSGSGDLIVEQGDEESLTIATDDNLIPLIRSDVQGGRLSIGPQNVNLRPTQTIRYHLKLRNLREVHLSGSLNFHADSIKSDRLSLSISGSGRASFGHLEAGTLSARISGSGTTTASGQVRRQEIRISGSGNHQAAELKSEQAEVHISGSGDASLWVVDSLNAHISGSGRVEYRGNAQVDSHVSGSGRVRHLRSAD